MKQRDPRGKCELRDAQIPIKYAPEASNSTQELGF